MPKVHLDGPFPINDISVHETVAEGPCVFLVHDPGERHVEYDADGKSAAKRISSFRGVYRSFRYLACDTADDAFRGACWLYHEGHQGESLGAHPRPPKGTRTQCPFEACGG